jgi:enterochelin esterase-like enzyme
MQPFVQTFLRAFGWTLGLAVVSAAPTPCAAQPLPQVSEGRIERLADFVSQHVAPRHVDVWLPAGYSPAKRYSVIYMHDGQMLFDANTTWNKQSWDAHLTVARLVREGLIPDALIVGIWNSGSTRHSEYYPEKFLPHLQEPLRQSFVERGLQGRPRSDAYLRFVVEELKPAIDARYATRREREHTVMLGSSMGGLISVYAFNEYPQVFGGAAGLSTHWIGSHQANASLPLAAFNYLRDRLRPPDGRRLYMDHGTTELDALYAPYQAFVDQIFAERGYAAPDWTSRVFEGTGHNEKAWAARLAQPLAFVLGPALASNQKPAR